MRIFISSVQKELAAERKALAGYLSGDPLLRRFFDAFRRKKPESGAKSRLGRDQVTGQVTGQVADPVADPVTDPVTDPVDRVILLLAAGEMSPSAMWNRLGLKHRPNFRENYLRPALERDLIEPTIPDKPTSRLQKYRLTEKGRRLLEKLEGGAE